MKTRKITMKEAVAQAIDEVKANYDSNVNFDVVRSVVFMVAKRIIDELPYRLKHNAFSPLSAEKPHSREFLDSLSFECAVQSVQAFRK